MTYRAFPKKHKFGLRQVNLEVLMVPMFKSFENNFYGHVICLSFTIWNT
jgi:hypothetical protein